MERSPEVAKILRWACAEECMLGGKRVKLRI